MKINKLQKGFTLFIAVVITATLLLVSTGIVSVAVKEAFLASAGRESQFAFYAADSGIECALYWDAKGVQSGPNTGTSAFSTSTNSNIIACNKDADNPSNQFTVGGSPTSAFTITFNSDTNSPCANVTVNKLPDGRTQIQSLGYNTCDPTNPRRVERAVRVSY